MVIAPGSGVPACLRRRARALRDPPCCIAIATRRNPPISLCIGSSCSWLRRCGVVPGLLKPQNNAEYTDDDRHRSLELSTELP